MRTHTLQKQCLHLAFYKGRETWVAKLICLLTRSPYSHCELVFRDGMSFGIKNPTDKTTFFQMTYPVDKWDLIPLTWITAEQETCIRHFCQQTTQSKYDIWAMLLGWWCPASDNPNKWFCSELCTRVLLPYTPSLRDKWYSPGSLYAALRTSSVFRA